MVSQKIHFRYWTSQNVLWFFYCFLLPLVFISHSVLSKATRAGCSGTRWTLGQALERWQRDKLSKFLHLKQPGDFIRPVMNVPWITHCHQRANAWLKVVDIIDNLFCLFFCLRLSLSCLLQYVFPSIALSPSISPRERCTLSILVSEVGEK